MLFLFQRANACRDSVAALGIEVKVNLQVLGGAQGSVAEAAVRFLRLYDTAGSRALSKPSSCTFVHGFIRQSIGFLVVLAEGVAYGEPIQLGNQLFGAAVEIF